MFQVHQQRNHQQCTINNGYYRNTRYFFIYFKQNQIYASIH
nr:MAG TPA: hypothetical protein [Caudoviricetes sp.]